MLTFPSVAETMGRAREAAGRFPFVILSGAGAALFAVIAVDESDPWLRATLAALLGLPLFAVLGLALERRRGRGLALRAAGLLIPVLFFLGTGDLSQRLLWLRFLHLALALHLCVAIVPFIGRAVGRGFWQFNRILFLRFLTGALFTGVLFAGLALALASLDPLFGIHLDFEIYPRLFFVLAFLFSPWFFVAGVPADLRALDARDDYPAGLRVFAQFILIPLVTVYLALLTTYLWRVLITRTWPSGWIGWLVSGVAVTGTLALLLVHPLREREDSRWVNAYGRWFYVAMLPSIAMLLVAIGLRIGQYGITEPRFFLLSLAVTLAVIALFYGTTASRDIRVIPAALGAVAIVTFVGPLSAYTRTERSQLRRIEEVLERNGLLRDGRAVPATQELSFEDRRQISGATQYLVETRGEQSVQPLLGSPAATVVPQRANRYVASTRTSELLAALNIRYTATYTADDPAYYYLTVEPVQRTALAVSGWDWLFEGDLTRPGGFLPGADSVRIRPAGRGRVGFRVERGSDVLAVFDLDDEIARISQIRAAGIRGMEQVPVDSLTFFLESDRADALVLIQSLNGRRWPDADTVDAAQARILIRLRAPR